MVDANSSIYSIEMYVAAIFSMFALLLVTAYNQPYMCSLHDSLECATTLCEVSVLVFGLVLAFSAKVMSASSSVLLESEPMDTIAAPGTLTVTGAMSAASPNATLATAPAAALLISDWVAPCTWLLLGVTFILVVVAAIADLRAFLFRVHWQKVRVQRRCLLSHSLFDVQICGRLLPNYLEQCSEGEAVNFRAMESLLLRRMLRQAGSGSFRSRREFGRIASVYPGALDWLAHQQDEASAANGTAGEPSRRKSAAVGRSSKEPLPFGDSMQFARARSLADHIARSLSNEKATAGISSFPTLILFQEAVAGDLIRWLSEESTAGERVLIASCLTELQRFELRWHAELYGSRYRRLLSALDRRRLPKAKEQKERASWDVLRKSDGASYELLGESAVDSKTGLRVGQRRNARVRRLKSSREPPSHQQHPHQRLLEKLARSLPCELVALMPNGYASGTVLVPQAAAYDSSRLVVPADSADLLDLARGPESPAKACLDTGQPTLVVSLTSDRRFQASANESDTSVLCVPLLKVASRRESVVATIACTSSRDDLLGEAACDHLGHASPEVSTGSLEISPSSFRRRLSFRGAAFQEAPKEDGSMLTVGVLKCVNKMDKHGRVGVAFDQNDVTMAQIFASLIIEEQEKQEKTRRSSDQWSGVLFSVRRKSSTMNGGSGPISVVRRLSVSKSTKNKVEPAIEDHAE